MSEIKTWREMWLENKKQYGTGASSQLSFAEKEITELRAALADREWRPIETAPKNKDRVLIFSEKRGVREARFYHENSDGNVWYDTMVGGGPMTIFYDATHWMPLPTISIDAMREGGVE